MLLPPEQVVPGNAFGVVYLVGVLVISTVWGESTTDLRYRRCCGRAARPCPPSRHGSAAGRHGETTNPGDTLPPPFGRAFTTGVADTTTLVFGAGEPVS